MALDNRPDYRQQKLTLKNNEINIKGANNGLLPTVDLIAFYGAAGLEACRILWVHAVPVLLLNALRPARFPPVVSLTVFPISLTAAARIRVCRSIFRFLSGNRVAQSIQVRSMLEYRQSQLSLKTVENVITIGIRNDVFTLENSRASVAAAQKARELSAQTLDAEQKKYNLGASTYLAVLQDERDLAQAESTVVSAMTNYAKARVQLDRDTAQTLDRYNIKIDEAVTGQIPHRTKCSGTIPNKTALQETNAPAQQPQQPPK